MRIFLSLVFCFTHLSSFAQMFTWELETLYEWAPETAKSNHIKKATTIRRVPKTHPDYNNPKHYSVETITSFDTLGRVIETVCRQCEIVPEVQIRKRGLSSNVVDKVDRFFYDRNRLVRKERITFKKESFDFIYDSINNKTLIVGIDEKKSRFAALIISYDRLGREMNLLDINFDNTWIEGDTAYQIFIGKTAYEYSTGMKTILELEDPDVNMSMFGINIPAKYLKIFKETQSLSEIEAAFVGIGLDFSKVSRKKFIHYDPKGNATKEIGYSGDISRLFTREGSGLIRRERAYSIFNYKYKYEFYKQP